MIKDAKLAIDPSFRAIVLRLTSESKRTYAVAPE